MKKIITLICALVCLSGAAFAKSEKQGLGVLGNQGRIGIGFGTLNDRGVAMASFRYRDGVEGRLMLSSSFGESYDRSNTTLGGVYLGYNTQLVKDVDLSMGGVLAITGGRLGGSTIESSVLAGGAIGLRRWVSDMVAVEYMVLPVSVEVTKIAGRDSFTRTGLFDRVSVGVSVYLR